ncbi:MAG: long-chain fatty acid--CoA ligase, partial [Longimicrobiales bacterium]
VFAYQFGRNAPFAAFCHRRGRTPESIIGWRDIPAVPTAAFKEVPLVAGDPATAEATFRTSGTTRGRQGTHVILDLSLYHGALVPVFRAYLLPDGLKPAILSLIPPDQDVADSSLAHMVSVVMDRLGGPGSGHHASVAGGIHEDSLRAALRDAERDGRPVLLLGTSFAFVHWTDGLRAEGERFRLPHGSRLMDTGGYKGRSRVVGEDELRRSYAELLGIDGAWCVNEYGMTELCSQFYDTTLRERLLASPVGHRRKVPPPWVRTIIVDPDTLEPLPAGQPGLLRIVDLANLGSVLAIQTEDVAVTVDDGFCVLGRAAGAQPRGCSLATEELLDAVRRAG